jgi:hypothetical protein
MKPDWKDAPSWANYVAMDADGEWWWFEREPPMGNRVWRSPEREPTMGNRMWRSERYGTTGDWRTTLESRPE